MSYEIMTEDQEGTAVATNTGWSDFCEWAETLDLENYFEVRHLAEHGFEKDLKELAEEIDEGLEEFPPDVKGVEDTARGIIAFINENPDAEMVMVTNGVVNADEDEDSDDDDDVDEDDDDYDDADYEETGR